MVSRVLGAASGRAQRGSSEARGADRGVRGVMLVSVLAVVLALGVCSVASAATFYWYGENNSTCWQEGQPGVPLSNCHENVGEHFLNSSNPPRVIGGALATNLELTTGSGDYCNAYNIGDSLTYTDEIDESSWTGLSPPSPYGSWQEGDAHKTVCQAVGSSWGQEIRGAANSECTGVGHEPCGMQHYVSFYSQGVNDRPWGTSFYSPVLLVSAEAAPETVTSHGGAWGYICPLFRQGTTNEVLEFCIEEWRTGTGYNSFDISAECSHSTNFNWSESITQFAPGTKFASEVAGSANTFVFESNPGPRTFIASISPADLINAINADNERCHAGLSTVPSEYALIGVEQGMEGRGLSELGAHTGNLKLYTEYTPVPAPTVETEPSNEWALTSALLHGSVDPNGVDTHYYFQYGTTTSYGQIVPAEPGGDLGNGTGSIPVYNTASGLTPNTEYHYRVVAKSSEGTSYGSDRTFRTLAPPTATTEAVSEVQQTQAKLNGSVNPNGSDTHYYFQYGTTTSYTSSTISTDAGSGVSSVPVSATIANLEPGTVYHYRVVATGAAGEEVKGSDQTFTTLRAEYVFYRGSNGGLENGYWTGHAWEFGPIGSAGAMTGSPSAVVKSEGRDLGRGVIDVFYRGSKNGLQNWLWNGSWSFSPLGEENVMAGNPSAIALPEGHVRVFFRDTKGGFYNWLWDGSKWTQSPLGEENVMAGNPSAIALPEGHVEVFFRDTKGGLYNWLWNGSAWSQGPIGGENVMAGNPSAIALPENNMEVYYRDVKNGLFNWWWNGSKWIEGALGGENAMTGDPFAIAWPNGERDVFYEAPKEVLYNWFFSTAWSAGPLSGEKAIAGVPTGVAW
jgi:hypothetical protein